MKSTTAARENRSSSFKTRSVFSWNLTVFPRQNLRRRKQIWVSKVQSVIFLDTARDPCPLSTQAHARLWDDFYQNKKIKKTCQFVTNYFMTFSHILTWYVKTCNWTYWCSWLFEIIICIPFFFSYLFTGSICDFVECSRSSGRLFEMYVCVCVWVGVGKGGKERERERKSGLYPWGPSWW